MWCATNLRHFVQMVSPKVLQIDVFVTNFAPSIPRPPRLDLRALRRAQTTDENGSLVPPSPVFSGSSKQRNKRPASRASSLDSSEDSDSAWSSDDSIVDLSYTGRYRRGGARTSGANEQQRIRDVDGGASYQGLYSDIDDEEDDLGDGRHFVVGLTNFEGEEDEREPGELSFSAKVKRQGQHVRRKTLVSVEAQQRAHPHSHHEELYHDHHPPYQPHQARSSPPHSNASPSRSRIYAAIEEEDADIGESIAATVLSRPLSRKGTSTDLPDSIAHRLSSHTPPLPPSRPISPSNVSRIALDPRVHDLRLDTQVSVHSPLSPQYQPSHHNSHAEHLASALRNQGSSPPPGHHRRVSRPEHVGHRRRLSSRMSIAESLYSQHGDESPPTESVGHHRSDSQSLRELLSASEAHLSTTRDAGFGALDYLFNLSAQEREDMGYIAALARSGRPRLDKILTSEVDRSSGAIAVACCGPSSLDAVVRKLVSSQIDPSRVKKGDQRGFITFYNEEFSF